MNKEIDLEVKRLQQEIYNCEHCASLRAQIVNLMNIRLSDPIKKQREFYQQMIDLGLI